MLTMAKKPKPKADESGVLRAKLHGPVVECIRYEGRLLGILADVEIVRHVMTDRFRKMGWLVPTDSGLVFRPPSEASVGEEK